MKKMMFVGMALTVLMMKTATLMSKLIVKNHCTIPSIVMMTRMDAAAKMRATALEEILKKSDGGAN